MDGSYTQKQSGRGVATVAIRELGGIRVFGYVITTKGDGSNGSNSTFVASPRRTLKGLVNANRGVVPPDVAKRLVIFAGVNPHYVAHYLPHSERLDFVLEAMQPTALD